MRLMKTPSCWRGFFSKIVLKYVAFDCEEGYFVYMGIAIKMKSVAQYLNTIFQR